MTDPSAPFPPEPLPRPVRPHRRTIPDAAPETPAAPEQPELEPAPGPAAETSAAPETPAPPAPEVAGVSRSAVAGIQAGEATIDRSAVGGVRADTVTVERSAVGGILARTASVRQALVRDVLGGEVRVEQSIVRTMVANRVVAGPRTGIVFLVARRVEGQPTVLFDWRGALALGAVVGAIATLWRLRRG